MYLHASRSDSPRDCASSSFGDGGGDGGAEGIPVAPLAADAVLITEKLFRILSMPSLSRSCAL
eukprot:1343756-Prymnesium_polylepis.1